MNNQNAGLHVLRNAHGMHVAISEFGAAMVSWYCPDRNGRMDDVLLGWADPALYAEGANYFGATVGRWANRIAGGQFMLDGERYQLAVNDRGNHLHGGPNGFHRRRWNARDEDGALVMSLFSPDGDAGFPGNVVVEACFRLLDDGTLSIDYQAGADAPTPINLTAHPFFNLNGGAQEIGSHLVQIHAGHYLAVDGSGIPTSMNKVDATAFDLRQPVAIGDALGRDDPQIRAARGFDHCFCIDPEARQALVAREVARVTDPASGRCLQVSSTEPGLQFYTGNYLDNVPGRHAHPYRAHAGFCLEAQAFPNQPNSAAAEQVILRPGRLYRRSTNYRMSVCA